MAAIMFVIGLTGSIGMGKTTTAQLFAEKNVPVHDADAIVHLLYEGEAVAVIEAAFPGTTKNYKVDRSALGQRIVGNADALRRLEAIVHPLVRHAETQFLEKALNSGAKVTLLDIPLLYETNGDQRVDAVVVVTAPAEVQRARVLERGINSAQLEALLARQLPDAEKRRRADFVVDTSRGIESARAQVQDILSAVAKMPKRRK
jgi:dephospho-CoA kinase